MQAESPQEWIFVHFMENAVRFFPKAFPFGEGGTAIAVTDEVKNDHPNVGTGVLDGPSAKRHLDAPHAAPQSQQKSGGRQPAPYDIELRMRAIRELPLRLDMSFRGSEATVGIRSLFQGKRIATAYGLAMTYFLHFPKAFPFGEGGTATAVTDEVKNLTRRYAPPSPKGRA